MQTGGRWRICAFVEVAPRIGAGNDQGILMALANDSELAQQRLSSTDGFAALELSPLSPEGRQDAGRSRRLSACGDGPGVGQSLKGDRSGREVRRRRPARYRPRIGVP